MKTCAITYADFTTTPIGTKSRLAEPLMGKPVIQHTIEAALKIESVSDVFVMVPTDQHELCQQTLKDMPVSICKVIAPSTNWEKILRAGRKWSLQSWRGGLGSTTYFDEFFHPSFYSGLLSQHNFDLALRIPPCCSFS